MSEAKFSDLEVMNIRRGNAESSNLICPFCLSDKVTSIGQYRRVGHVFYMWWRCLACRKKYGLTP